MEEGEEPSYCVPAEYRITSDRLELVNSLLKRYEGTLNHHNFTSGKKPNDPSAKRYIISFKVEELFEHSGMVCFSNW